MIDLHDDILPAFRGLSRADGRDLADHIEASDRLGIGIAVLKMDDLAAIAGRIREMQTLIESQTVVSASRLSEAEVVDVRMRRLERAFAEDPESVYSDATEPQMGELAP